MENSQKLCECGPTIHSVQQVGKSSFSRVIKSHLLSSVSDSETIPKKPVSGRNLTGCSGILISMFLFLLIPFHSTALCSFNCFGQNLLQTMAPKKLKKDRKRDFRVLVGSKLNMSQQRALAAKKASSTPSSINRSTASTALPEKNPKHLLLLGKEEGWQ